MKALKTEKILSVNICSSPKKLIIDTLQKRMAHKKRTVVFTPNTQMILNAQASKKAIALLNSSTLNVPDGTGVVMASKLLGGKIKARISGIDLADALLHLAQKRKYRVFLLGAKRGIAKKARKNLKACYPKLKICGTHHGYFKKNGKENEKIIKKINAARPDVIFVCFGSPAQEIWITKNARALNSVKLFIGLGGSLDVWAGNIKRAPVIFQITGLEWLYRTVKEPKRAKIFIDIPRFLFEVLMSKSY